MTIPALCPLRGETQTRQAGSHPLLGVISRVGKERAAVKRSQKSRLSSFKAGGHCDHDQEAASCQNGSLPKRNRLNTGMISPVKVKMMSRPPTTLPESLP